MAARPIKVGDIVSPIIPFIHPKFDGMIIGKDVKCHVTQIIDRIAMIVPWNCGHECMTYTSNLYVRG